MAILVVIVDVGNVNDHILFVLAEAPALQESVQSVLGGCVGTGIFAVAHKPVPDDVVAIIRDGGGGIENLLILIPDLFIAQLTVGIFEYDHRMTADTALDRSF